MEVAKHPLQKLNMDGQATLLSHLGDKENIQNFCTVFPQYERTYLALIHKYENLDTEKLLRDALEYRRESVWIAYYRGSFNRWGTETAKVKDAIDQYAAYNAVKDSYAWKADDNCYDLPLSTLKDKIIANHRYILKIFQYLVKHELDKRDATENRSAVLRRLLSANHHPTWENTNEIWTTVTEEQDIIRALYRLWILALMSGRRKEHLQRDLWLSCVMSIWGGTFWESMQVFAVQKILGQIIEAEIDRAIYKDKDNKILRDGVDPNLGKESMKLKIVNCALLHDFPSLIPNWIQPAGTRANPQKRIDHIKEICQFLSEQRCVELDVPVACQYLHESHIEYYQRNLTGDDYIDQYIHFQRICKPTANVRGTPTPERFLWIRLDDIKHPEWSPVDMTASIWGDRRRKAWGFKFPSVVSSNLALLTA
ncbi:hypothetical protein TWF481_004540 [Arthrobotrys musiformis]|uniref:Uncharacterized protein n=1 Tax=Arthrobotrys musiformis TaxID=47236 RepID=A0AAV9WKY4_9PEZI